MKTLYDVIKDNPKLLEGLELSKSDIAAANYLYMISGSLTRSEISNENDGAWIHVNSDYNEAVAKIIENHPNAVKLIMNLSEGYGIFTGGLDSQFTYLLVDDYLKNNFASDNRKHNF